MCVQETVRHARTYVEVQRLVNNLFRSGSRLKDDGRAGSAVGGGDIRRTSVAVGCRYFHLDGGDSLGRHDRHDGRRHTAAAGWLSDSRLRRLVPTAAFRCPVRRPTKARRRYARTWTIALLCSAVQTWNRVSWSAILAASCVVGSGRFWS